MRDSKAPFEIMNVFDNKMLAGRVELALLRVQRTKTISEMDAKAFSRIAQLLKFAAEGDVAVAGSRLTATNEQSLEVLREVIRTLMDKFPEAKLFRNMLTKLKQTAEDLSKDTIPNKDNMTELYNFAHKYGLIQTELLKEQYGTAPAETSIWPLMTRLGYSSTL